jgi:hypothetical protein
MLTDTHTHTRTTHPPTHPPTPHTHMQTMQDSGTKEGELNKNGEYTTWSLRAVDRCWVVKSRIGGTGPPRASAARRSPCVPITEDKVVMVEYLS